MSKDKHNINDFVMYSHNGIYKIDDITAVHLKGMDEKEYYILRSVYDSNVKIMVPCDNEKLVAKMRRILSVDEINAIIEKSEELSGEWIENCRSRAEEFARIIDEGDAAEILRIVKVLSLHRIEVEEQRKKFLSTDERILNSAEKIIAENFAFVLGIDKKEVTRYIINQINETKKECID